jgi:2-dehydropantoate 2-reductase
VVLLQPDLDDRMLLLERVEAARLVQGLIGFLSFQSPLPRAPNLPKGIGYTLLPGAANVFDGSRADDVVAVLRKGGMSARRQSDLPGRSAERSATTVPIIAGLEAAGWSIAGFTAGPWLSLSLPTSREALAVVSHSLSRPPKRVAPRLAVAVALKLAPRFTPFDLEAYLEFHFSKVGPQTRLISRPGFDTRAKPDCQRAQCSSFAMPCPEAQPQKPNSRARGSSWTTVRNFSFVPARRCTERAW